MKRQHKPLRRVAPPRSTARYCLCLLLQLVSLSAFANYQVELSAPDPIKDLLATHLDLMRYRNRDDIHADQLDFMVATAADQVRDLAATEGFFSTTTDVKLDKDGPVPVVRIAVNAGPPTTVSGTDIEVSGPAREQSPAQAQEVIQSWTLRPGAPFRQRDWAAAKDRGLRLLQERRYPAASIADSHAAIHADQQQAELAVTYESGPLFTLGRLEITGTDRYPESIIRNVNPLQEGEEYDVSRLLTLQRAIQRTPYFSNSIVTVDKDPANAAGAPVEVKVTEYRTQRLRAGAGYATDTGARVEGRYSHNNVFGRAWVFDSQVRIEQRRQTGTLDLAMPPDSTAYVNSVHASTEHTTLEGIDLLSRRLGARRARSTDTDDYAYTIEYYRDRLDQLSGAAPSPDIITAEGSHQALVAGYARTHRDVDDPLFPRKGYIASAEAGIALKGLLTDQTFFRAYGRLRRYWPVGKRDLVLLRSELGAVISKPGNAAIPASLLFRAGGTESVRGYDFQSIGNVRNGVVFPTRYLATAGLEYQHWLSASWGGAVFYDVGTATDNWGDKQLFQGVGVGARWRSPVGPVNIDVAYGIRDKNIRPHFSLGVAF